MNRNLFIALRLQAREFEREYFESSRVRGSPGDSELLGHSSSPSCVCHTPLPRHSRTPKVGTTSLTTPPPTTKKWHLQITGKLAPVGSMPGFLLFLGLGASTWLCPRVCFCQQSYDLERINVWFTQKDCLAGSKWRNWKYLLCHGCVVLFLYERRDKDPEGKGFFISANHSIPHPLLVKKYLSHMHSWREFSKNTQPTRILFIPQTLPGSCKPLLRRAPPLSAHQHFLAPLIPAGQGNTGICRFRTQPAKPGLLPGSGSSHKSVEKEQETRSLYSAKLH